jgi:hypothetical protein
MPTDSTEDFQKQTLDLLRAQQEAYLTAVKAWRDAMAAGAAQMPAWPKFPNAQTIPTPAEVAEASYAFAAKLLADQSRFMEELSRAMTAPPEKK